MILDRLDGYIARNVLLAVIVVQVVLLGLDLIIAYIDNLSDIEGGYGAFDVFVYLCMRLPWRFYQYSPVGVLIGALIGLGSMASSNELTVMRAAGRSLTRILWGVMKPIILVVVIVLCVAEFVSPRTEQFAEAWRVQKQQGAGTLITERGGWQREGDDFYRFATIRADDTVLGVTRYHFDNHKLLSVTTAKQAVWQEDHWQLQEVAVTHISENSTRVEIVPTMRWDTAMSPQQLTRLLRDVETQAPSELWAYAQYLEAEGQGATQPLLYFWQKVLMPLTMASLVLVAASFVFGPLRSVAAGTRVFYGVITGLIFKYMQDLLAPASTVFGFSPAWAVLAPTMLCVVFGLYLLRRSG